MSEIRLIHGDCLEKMKEIPDGSVDMVLADPPYGVTACKWDSVIPIAPMWEQLNRVIKPTGAIALFGSEPFSSALRMSNIKNYKYDWVWVKSKPNGWQHSKNKPMSKHEIVSVFSLAPMGHKSLLGDRRMEYNPQGVADSIVKKVTATAHSESMGARPNQVGKEYVSQTGFPSSVLEYGNIVGKSAIHPTQKPVDLLEYLIKTYTNEGETVLDFTMGSGSTGVACVNTNRNFIGIELDEKYFNIAKDRIEEAKKNIKFSLKN
jgi:site-specific DNA-methyltransferase (adenine-specific)